MPRKKTRPVPPAPVVEPPPRAEFGYAIGGPDSIGDEIGTAVEAFNALASTARVAYLKPLTEAVIASQTLVNTAKAAIASQLATAQGAYTDLSQAAKESIQIPLSQAFETASQIGAIDLGSVAESPASSPPAAPVTGSDWAPSTSCSAASDPSSPCWTVWLQYPIAVCPQVITYVMRDDGRPIRSTDILLHGPDSLAGCNQWASDHHSSLVLQYCPGTGGDGVPPPPPPPAPAFSVWVRADGSCYYQLSSLPPLASTDVLSYQTSVESDAQSAVLNCQSKVPPPPTELYNVWEYTNGSGCFVLAVGEVPPQTPDRVLKAAQRSLDDANAIASQCTSPPPPPKPAECDYDTATVQIPLIPQWCDTDICDRIGAIIAQVSQGDPASVQQLIGFLTSGGKPALPTWLESAIRSLPTSFQCPIADFVYGAAQAISSIISRAGQDANPKWAAMVPFAVIRAVLGFVEHYTSIGLGDAVQKLDYTLNAISPTEIPTAGEAMEMYLATVIDAETWECLTRANNVCETWAQKLYYARLQRLTPYESIAAWRRKLIDDSVLKERLREERVIRPSDRELLIKLSEEIPAVGDIIRFMVRNVYDADLVRAFKLDDEFEAKFTGQLPAWATAAGIGDEQIRAEWRAHWVIPSPQQLYEMLRRLRPGHVDPSVAVTLTDVKRALGENDILPFWRQRLIEISYQPFTRVDLRRLYSNGIIGKDELIERYQDIGYSPGDSVKQADFADRLLGPTIAKDPWIRAYKSGGVTQQQAIDQLTKKGYTLSQIDDAFRTATLELQSESRQACVKSLHAQFEEGWIDGPTVTANLLAIGMDQKWVNLKVSGWICERQAKGKQATAAQLCEWFGLGLLSTAEFTSRLLTAGWNAADAARIIKSCDSKVEQKKAASILKRAKEEERQARQAQKDQELLAKQRLAAANATASKSERASSTQERIARALVKAGTDYAKISGLDPLVAGQQIQDLFRRLQSDLASGPQTTADGITEAVRRYKLDPAQDFGQLALDTVNELNEDITLELNGNGQQG